MLDNMDDWQPHLIPITFFHWCGGEVMGSTDQNQAQSYLCLNINKHTCTLKPT